MNNLDFERTQIWAKNLVSAPPIPAAAPAPQPPAPKPRAATQKPVLKTLTKEEKIVLAAGGALAIGLGAIVISSLSDDQIVPKTPPPVANLNAPKLDLGIPVEKPLETEPPKPHHTPPPARPAPHKEPAEAPAEHHPVAKADGHHALLEIPETPEVATSVGDDLSFIDAFNTARNEVGPAGLFAWRNTYYSTFTDKEWEAVPEEKKEQWLEAAEPIIDPVYEQVADEPAVALPEQQHVIVAERGTITWTGIDKDGDGQAEILMARINGQSPMVLMDTDGDGILDTRYDYEAASGKTYASAIEPFSMSTADIEQLEFVSVEADMGFFNQSGNEHISGPLPVSIIEKDNHYVISLDSNMDNTIDAITYLTDESGPVVGLDFDNDGQIEMGFVYDTDSQTVNSTETDPMEEMTFGPPEYPDLSLNEDPGLLNGYEADALSLYDDETADDLFSNDADQGNDDDVLS